VKKKQHNSLRKTLIVSLIQQGERSNIKIAAQARCSAGYVAVIRSKLKKATQLESNTVPFEPAEENPSSVPVWLVVVVALVAIAAIVGVFSAINSI